jgi:DNA-binding response OmpR family regulator
MIDGRPSPLPAATARTRSVLVIDRDAETRLAARRGLERAGFAVSTAAEEGGCVTGRFDLVIADLASVSLAGLRRQHPQARVLALSNEGGADLAKPFTSSQLLTAVRLCLARCATTGSPRR